MTFVRSEISIRDTFLPSLMVWWRHNVTWRHMTSCADVSKKFYPCGHPNVVFRRELPKREKWGVNHFSTSFRWKAMTNSEFCWIFDVIMSNHHRNFRNVFFSWYGVLVWISRHLPHLNGFYRGPVQHPPHWYDPGAQILDG